MPKSRAIAAPSLSLQHPCGFLRVHLLSLGCTQILCLSLTHRAHPAPQPGPRIQGCLPASSWEGRSESKPGAHGLGPPAVRRASPASKQVLGCPHCHLWRGGHAGLGLTIPHRCRSPTSGSIRAVPWATACSTSLASVSSTSLALGKSPHPSRLTA